MSTKYDKNKLKESFLEKAIQKHSNKYNYNKINYVNAHTKVEIVCPYHGSFFKSPAAHLYGSGECKKCHFLIAKYKKNSQEDFLSKAKLIHKDKYDYFKSVYKKFHQKLIVICPLHGEFLTTPARHISKKIGCPHCSKENLNKNKIHSFEIFIEKANKIHNNKYQYIKKTYIQVYKEIEIICPKHGIFSQLGSNHLKGHGCPRCANSISSQEEFIKKFLTKYKISFKERFREIIKPKEVDFYIPSYKLAIECNGIRWHSELFGKNKKYHLSKLNELKKKNIRLIQILDLEILNKSKIVISRLKSILHLNKYSLYARKCQIYIISSGTKSVFLNKYHIQGNDKSRVNLGLFYKKRLVSVMTFSSLRKSLGTPAQEKCYELSRFCSISNFNIIGGASKLLSFFEKQFNPKYIKTFADKRWSNGNMYFRLGFKHVRDSSPNYWYFKDTKIKFYHRFNFRKNILAKRLSYFNAKLSEWENMKSNGWNRIWDCGNMVFEKLYESTKDN